MSDTNVMIGFHIGLLMYAAFRIWAAKSLLKFEREQAILNREKGDEDKLRSIEDDDSICGVDAGRSGSCNASYWVGEAADRIEELEARVDELKQELDIEVATRHTAVKELKELESTLERVRVLPYQWRIHADTKIPLESPANGMEHDLADELEQAIKGEGHG